LLPEVAVTYTISKSVCVAISLSVTAHTYPDGIVGKFAEDASVIVVDVELIAPARVVLTLFAKAYS
jgi:hypothetical protein